MRKSALFLQLLIYDFVFGTRPESISPSKGAYSLSFDPHGKNCFGGGGKIFTSRSAVRYWLEESPLSSQIPICVGKATAQNLVGAFVAEEETQEGVIALLDRLDLQDAFLLWPKSKQARGLLTHYLQEKKLSHDSCDLYETLFREIKTPLSLEGIEEIVFTSPSTVRAFLQIYRNFPTEVRLTSLGSVTGSLLPASETAEESV
jgi:uroporphyrinogen-III synthase